MTVGRLARLPDLAPPQDLEAEEAVLGAIMLSDRLLEPLATEVRLRPHHFYRVEHRHVYTAMLELERHQTAIDRLTLRAQLERDGRLTPALRAFVDALGVVPLLGNVRAYGERLVELARWRDRIRADLARLEAAASRDEDAYHAAGRELDDAAGEADTGYADPEQLARELADWYDAKDADSIPLPFGELTELMRGGLRPGDTTVLSGHTSMGKSVLGDQILEHAARAGRRACLYMNEMAKVDRTARLIAGRTNLPFDRIISRKLRPEQLVTLNRALAELPFGMQPCAGWAADDIARHVRRHRWDVAMVDLATQIPARETSEWDHISRTLTQAARQSGCHLIIVVQLNREAGGRGVLRDIPTLKHLRNTGAWEQDARNVMFVHRAEEEHDGVPELLLDGLLIVAKQSNGPLGSVPITLNPRSMRFEQLSDYRRP